MAKFTPSRIVPQFQPPPPGLDLVANPAADIKGGLDSLFNSYLQMQQNKRAQDLAQSQLGIQGAQLGELQRNAANQNIQETILYGRPLTQFTPEQIQQAAQPQATSGSYPAYLNPAANVGPQSGMMIQNPVPESPDISHLRAGMESLRAQREAQLAGAGAELQAKQAGTQKTLTEAQLNQQQIDALRGAGGPGGFIQNFSNAVRSGKASLGDLSEVGRSPIANALRLGAAANIFGQGIDVNRAAAQAAQQKAVGTSLGNVQGGKTQEIGTIVGVVDDTLQSAQPLVEKLNTNQIKMVNSAILSGQAHINDPEAQALLTKLNILKNRYAVVSSYPNAPTSAQLDHASQLISSGLSGGSFKAMGDAMREEGNSIVRRAGGAGYNEPNPNVPQGWSGEPTYTYPDGTTAVWNGSNWVKK